MNTPTHTPLQQTYLSRKAEQPKSTILLFKMGDFYEAFFDDAKILAKTLGIALTKRAEAPMAGVPYWAIDSWTAKLKEAGYKVVTEDPFAK